ncbi:hypothetical protein SAMN05660657_04961 [Geodermatophilus amargosae]|uniref:SGNH/GDSL hydrolase family protein n=1 Tax=Geodermatophilus amargosae TaxID=1296565 RepID=A0A1I7CW67_9ACTN|nr:SGNH/GDSL hydrolase family protein [Geodermatophilus amargosae]SFU03616.1 hypothetical protein SAMN05660657_04961 [Geodermatophilus amargosae]
MGQSAGRGFLPSATDFWQANRVPRSPQYPPVAFTQWLHGDSEENYLRRGNRAFSPDSVGYRFNSMGYRGPEFDRDAGDLAVVFVGDSNTFGLGMPYERLWTSLVTKSLADLHGRTVRQFNLGFGATGSDYVAMMVHQSIDALRPDAVCVLWPSTARISWFPTPRRQLFFLPDWRPDFNTEEHAAFLRLSTEAQTFFNFVRNFQLVRARLAECGIPYHWGVLEPVPTEVLQAYTGLDGYVGAWEPVDLARDGRHAGIDSHAEFAAAMVQGMASEGLGPAGTGSAAPQAVAPPRPRARLPVATAPPRVDALFRPARQMITSGRLGRRIRAMRRRDPFIY